MENYEVKNVSQASEIRKAYEDAVKGNAKFYRAVSKSNLIYGWDEKINKHVKAEIGQEWFENPHYEAPQEEVVEPVEEPIEECVAEDFAETIDEIVKEEESQEVVEVEEEKPDYEAMYNLAQGTIKDLTEKVSNLEYELDKVNKDFANYKEVVEKFKAL